MQFDQIILCDTIWIYSVLLPPCILLTHPNSITLNFWIFTLTSQIYECILVFAGPRNRANGAHSGREENSGGEQRTASRSNQDLPNGRVSGDSRPPMQQRGGNRGRPPRRNNRGPPTMNNRGPPTTNNRGPPTTNGNPMASDNERHPAKDKANAASNEPKEGLTNGTIWRRWRQI